MQIQSLLFARQFDRRPGPNCYDAQDVSPITPFLDGLPQQFPARVSRQVLVTLWRPSPSGVIHVSLRFQLLDPTGTPTAYPCPAPFEAAFPDGQRLCFLVARLDLEFPTPGRYSLDILPAGYGPEHAFHFAIDTALDHGDLPMRSGLALRASLPPGVRIVPNSGMIVGSVE